MVQTCVWDAGSGTSPVNDRIPPVSLDLWFSHLRSGNFNKAIFFKTHYFLQ